MISQAVQTEVVTQLATLNAKVGHMERGMRSWFDRRLEKQVRRVQGRLDTFESRISRQLRSGQTSEVADIKFELAEIKKIVSKLYEIPVVVEPIVQIVIPTVYVPNIWADPADIQVKKTKEQIKKREIKKKEERETEKRAIADNIQDEQD